MLPIKEQQTLGRKARVQRTRLSAMFSPRKKNKTFQLQNEDGTPEGQESQGVQGVAPSYPGTVCDSMKGTDSSKVKPAEQAEQGKRKDSQH